MEQFTLSVGDRLEWLLDGRMVTFIGGTFFGVRPRPGVIEVPPGATVSKRSRDGGVRVSCIEAPEGAHEITLVLTEGDAVKLPSDQGVVRYVARDAGRRAATPTVYVSAGQEIEHVHQGYTYRVYRRAAQGSTGGGGAGQTAVFGRPHALLDMNRD